MDQLRKKIRYLKLIMNQDRSVLQEMADEQMKYKRELSSIKGKLTVIDEMEKTQNKQLQAVKKSMEKKVILLTKIHQEKEFYETVVKELQQAAYKLKETLLNLDRERKKRTPLPTHFEASKGKLPFPFNGKIIKDKSQVGTKTLHIRKGIYIGGPLGSEIKAVFPGRVDFSGQLKGYGQVIVVNHGSRFFTISAHLLQRNKQEGDMVEEGDVIGLLGQSGSLLGPRLYFEVREGGKNLDPIKWLKVN
jgi:septal ring factor EnvC (AmiA/AmiB activator)